MWEVVCVIREVTHAHFSRHGQDLRYRVCVTESALGDGDGVRAFVAPPRRRRCRPARTGRQGHGRQRNEALARWCRWSCGR